jgi:MFS family permease
MLATIMQAVDTTIANVALPHMQGSMGATQDQISWVLTSYIVASAICMPLTGFLAARWGRKRVFMASVVGFTITSMLCGAAQSLEQIVLFRLLQGVFGACLVPLSQSILLDAYPRERHGAAHLCIARSIGHGRSDCIRGWTLIGALLLARLAPCREVARAARRLAGRHIGCLVFAAARRLGRRL